MRDNNWLLEKTKLLWNQYFNDIRLNNEIVVLFGRRNKRVLGSIKLELKARITLIRVNGYFRDEKIPEELVMATLAHEIAHYAHGFSTAGKRMYRYPHQGGVVSRELKKRNLGELEKETKKWLKKNWNEYLKNSQ